mmetsp:Transcript_3215/g.6514  ORF Transcript_3215/g.6514 Transcript_3215/m.6514 type:complete len:204 (-) Transcript_3215:148-759(-)
MFPLLHARRAPPTLLKKSSVLSPVSSPISTTPHLSAPKPAQKSSDEPKTKQKKVKSKDKTPKTSPSQENERNRIEQLLAKAYDAPITKPPSASEEEMARRYRIGRNYVIGCFERHNRENHELAVKIRMKRRALKMLPKEGQLGDAVGGDGRSVYGKWREEALKIEQFHGPPSWRHVPMLTPPIPGFDPSVYLEMMKDEEEEDS